MFDNGEVLGLYSHIESIKKDFLARNFADNEGNLYEGQLSDFRPDWVGTFQRKTNKSDPDRSDLEAVVSALTASNDEVFDELSEHVDMDDFFAFWAMETLVRHNDGYSSNANNYYIYADLQTERFHFIPWGIDSILANELPEPPQPATVWAEGVLANRLFAIPTYRDQYLDRLTSLLDEVWHEQELLATVDQYVQLIDPYVNSPRFEQAVGDVRTVIQTERAVILDELAAGEPQWTEPLPDPLCAATVGQVSGSFSTTWGSLTNVDPITAGTGTLSGTVDGHNYTSSLVWATSGATIDDDDQSQHAIVQIVGQLDDGSRLYLTVEVYNPEAFQAGVSFSLDALTAFASLTLVTEQGDESELGFVLDGTVSLQSAGMTSGATVSGTFESAVLRIGS